MEQIWFIDDIPADIHRVSAILTKLNADVRVTSCSNFSEEADLYRALPQSEAMNRIELAFVDLELIKERGKGEMLNVSGGSIVLPYLRKHCPWIAIVAFSDYFSQDDLTTTPTIGCYPFDGMMLKRSLIGGTSFHYEQWGKLCDRWRKNTFERICQRPWTSVVSELPELSWQEQARRSAESVIKAVADCPSKRESQIKYIAQALELLEMTIRQMFSFASNVSILALVPGLSGAAVFKVRCARRLSDGLGDSEWVLKMSAQPHKLWREVTAHRDVIEAGIDVGVTVPLLYNGVLACRGVGLIAYQFAKHSGTLFQILRDVERLELPGAAESPLVAFGESLVRLYQEPTRQGLQVNELISHYLKTTPFPVVKVHSKPCHTAGDIVCAIYGCSLSDLAITQRITCLWSLIHGDLHSRNVLAGRQCTLIDFSNAKSGPIALDAAKLISDLFIECPHLFAATVSYRELLADGGWGAWLRKILPGAGADDAFLFDLVLLVFLSQARGYYDTVKESKAMQHRVQNAISKLDGLLVRRA